MLISDLHIHTMMSGHAFCTINECIETAQNRGLSLIAFTDHGPAMEHSAHEGYFEMFARLPRLFGGLNVLFGCEMNILNKSGDVDLSKETMSGLDIILAGLHERTPYKGTGELENTSAIINAMMRYPEINIITHPFRAEFPVSINDVVQAAKEYNVLLEINLSLLLSAIRQKSNGKFATIVNKTAELISCLQLSGSGYVINSDAHYSEEIGINDEQYKLLTSELGILHEFVLNDNIVSLKHFIPSIRLSGGS